MTGKLFFVPTTLVLPLGQGLVRLFQAAHRRNVVADVSVVALLNATVGGADAAEIKSVWNGLPEELHLADASEFSLWESAHVNPDFFGLTNALEALPFDAAVDLLCESGILSRQWPPIYDHHKRGFADRFKGNFYEQIGTEALFNRVTPPEWWTGQKFEPSLTELRPTPYKYIEADFLSQYVASEMTNADVLDIGCGTGFFTNLIAERARSVIGLDHNENYIAAANKLWGRGLKGNLSFVPGDIIDLDTRGFAQRKFDVVTIIDTFLFLFDERYQKRLSDNRLRIMKNVSNMLARGGRLVIVDPHPLWLTPWIGEDAPMVGILTEYRHKRFKVSPTLEEATGLLYRSGLRIRRILEPDINPAFAEISRAAHAFMHEIPQWWVIECELA
jgi:SAM-dependent methyltransferase